MSKKDDTSIIKLVNVSKSYYNKGIIASGFSKVNLELNMGEFVVITGESGSGKSTLLNVISGLDSYDDGEMYINGKETSHYSESDYENYRRKYIGNIFQNFNLVNSYTVYQNIELVLLLNGYNKMDIKKKVLEVIDIVGLKKYKRTKVSKLSGGQKQRVAIARALVKDTPIIVADEPTGNLDQKSAKAIMKLLYEISHDKLVIVVTHNYEQVEEYATRRIVMHDGRITLDKKIRDTSNKGNMVSEYRDIRFINKIRLGIRNAFNIRVKFLLLIFVYLILSLFVFAGYSSLKKADFDDSNVGYSPIFNDSSSNRVIVNKVDKSAMTDEDIEKLSNINNVSYVFSNDIVTDTSFTITNDNEYYYGNIKNIKDNDIVLYKGEMPKDDFDIVIMLNKWEKDDDIINKTLRLSDDSGAISGIDVRVTGTTINRSDNGGVNVFYVSDRVLNEVSKIANFNYSKLYMTINDKIYLHGDENGLYYSLRTSDNLHSGEAIISDTWNDYCEKGNCLNRYINLKDSNIYYTDSIDVRVKSVFNSSSFEKLTGFNKEYYSENTDTLFISNEDFDKLYDKPSYQASLYLDDVKKLDSTISTLKDMGYNVYSLKKMVNASNSATYKLNRVIRGIVFSISLIVLFFISYFIIKLILKSRNNYYSTIRTLGSTKGVCRSLLNIELFIDINIAYLLFISLVLLTYMGIISNSYISDMITYFSIRDYVFVYIILIVMSFIISNRYAYKLFSTSIMSSYREEV